MKELEPDPVTTGSPETTDEAAIPEAEPITPDGAGKGPLPVEMVVVTFQPWNELELELVDTG